jgi:hypothetical protein
MGKKTYLSQLTSGIGGKMSKRIYQKCPNINKMDCLVNKPLENVVEDVTKNDFIIVYTFDIQTNINVEEDNNPKMLIMSILSCIREFKDLTFKIFIYTTNINTLYDYLIKYETIMKYITIEKYDPTVYGLPQQLLFGDNYGPIGQVTSSLDYEPFINGIGHARVFIIDGLRKKYRCPIVYMDNDTGIGLGKGKSCYEMIKQTKTIRGYQIEIWTSFLYLYTEFGQLEKIIEIKEKYKNTFNVDCKIVNNGIIIYGYTNNIADNNTVENAIILIQDIYRVLLSENHSHYNDMHAFSIACDMLNISDVICDIYYKEDIIMPQIVINQLPIFNHYYYNKHYFSGYIDYVFNNIINLYFQNKPLKLSDDLRKDNISCLITNIFTNDQNESVFYDQSIRMVSDNDAYLLSLNGISINSNHIHTYKCSYDIRLHTYYCSP